MQPRSFCDIAFRTTCLIPGILAAVLLALLGIVGTIRLYDASAIAPQLPVVLLWGAVACIGFIFAVRIVILLGIWIAIAAMLARRGVHTLFLRMRAPSHSVS